MANDIEFLVKWKPGAVLLHAADEAGAIVALGKYLVNQTNRHRITVQPYTRAKEKKDEHSADIEFLVKWKPGAVLLHAADEAGAIVALGKYLVNQTNRHRITVQPYTRAKEKKDEHSAD